MTKIINFLKSIIRPVLNRFPRLKGGVNRIRLSLWRSSYQNKAQKGERFAALDKIFVRPSRVKEYIIRDYDKWKDRGKILDGHWDQHRGMVEELDVFQAFQARFFGNKSWQETPFYQRVLNQLANGAVKWGCKTQADFDQRCEGLDRLFQTIKDNGYLSQEELPDRKDTPLQLYDEVSVCVDRDGQLLFEDGRHRFCIAKLLELDEIPVQVTVRHRDWYNFRRDIIAYASRNDGRVYAPLLHPDLQNIPSVHGHQRFEVFKLHLPENRGKLLDIGAHWGYFCHRFEDEGFDCYAAEMDEAHLHFMKKLRKADNKQFHIIDKSIFDYHDQTDFEIVLALNIFHHFLKNETDYQQLISLLGRLNMNVMFFEPHLTTEPQMVNAYANYDPDKFAAFIVENSCLNHVEMIGEAEDSRRIYKLSK